jgi:hypothetical protein
VLPGSQVFGLEFFYPLAEIGKPANYPLRRLVAAGLPLTDTVEVLEVEDGQVGEFTTRSSQKPLCPLENRRVGGEPCPPTDGLIAAEWQLGIGQRFHLSEPEDRVAGPRLQHPMFDLESVQPRPDQQVVDLAADRPL